MKRAIDLDKLDIDGRRVTLAERGFKKAAPGRGNADPETLGGSRTSIKALVNHNAKTLEDAVSEFRFIEEALDRDDLVPTERVLLNRRWRTLFKRMQGTDARYKAVGAVVGTLSREKRAHVDQYKALAEYERNLLIEEIRQSWWRPGDNVVE